MHVRDCSCAPILRFFSAVSNGATTERQILNRTFSSILQQFVVLQQRPQKEEGTGSRITTFVCMTKINHWGVGGQETA